MTQSLQTRLQWQLAITLTLVMGLMWLVGYLLPHPTAYVEAANGVIQSPNLGQVPRFRWLFPFLALGAIAITLLVQGLVIRHSFKRFQSVQAELKQLELGKIQQLSTQVPSEIQPLVQEFNHILSLLYERLERSRNALGNLAHALKTPLNLLLQQLDNEQIPITQRQALQMQIERIRQLTERELKRARMAGIGTSTQRFDPHVEMLALLQALQQIYQHTPRQVTLRLPATITRFGDREDLLELLGNVLDNAYKWSKSTIHLAFKQVDTTLQITIEDDGLGQDKVALQVLTQRGIRLDESVQGHGLGLAICRDITRVYGGTLSFGESATLGGFKVTVTLPLGLMA